MRSILVVAAVLSVAMVASAEVIQWSRCTDPRWGVIPATTTVECATVTVPLDYAHPVSPINSIQIGVARVYLNNFNFSTQSTNHIWVVSGAGWWLRNLYSNGHNGLDLMPYGTAFLSMDSRGKTVDCPTARASGQPTACFKEVEESYGQGFIDNFTISNVGRDLDYVINQVSASKGVQFHVHGCSFGTLTVQKYLWFRTSRPTTVVLEGVVPDGHIIERDQTSVGRHVMSECEVDPFCAGQFGSEDPMDALVTLFNQYRDSSPLTTCVAKLFSKEAILNHPAHRWLALQLAEQARSSPGRSLIPALVRMLMRCNDLDVTRLRKMFPNDNSYIYSDFIMAIPITYLQESSEAAPTLSKQHVVDTLNTLPFASWVALSDVVSSEDWGHLPPRDETYRRLPATGDLPVLVLNGNMDTQTGFHGASWLAQNLPKPNKVTLVAVPSAGHEAVFWNSPVLSGPVPCAMRVYSSFINSMGQGPLDTSCFSDVVPLDFQAQLKQTQVKAVNTFGTTNIWN